MTQWDANPNPQLLEKRHDLPAHRGYLSEEVTPIPDANEDCVYRKQRTVLKKKKRVSKTLL